MGRLQVDVAIGPPWIRGHRAAVSKAVRTVLRGEGIGSAAISVAVVDDRTIHELNRRYLQHDYPTDVLSFPLEAVGDHLEGEIIVCADRAEAVARDYGWSPAEEVLLYVVHGMLHLAGYDDHSPGDRKRMRGRERYYLDQLGIGPPAGTSRPRDARPRQRATKRSAAQ